MFENEDFDLDEEWFADNLPDELGNLNTKPPGKCIQKLINANLTHSQPHNAGTSTLKTNIAKKMVMKRKFPGPAGLFPQGDSTKSNKDDYPIDSDSFILSTQYLSSQNLNLTFEEPTWLDMCKDFNRDTAESSLLNEYNIEWIRNNITRNLVNRKVPILAGIIKQIKSTTKSPIFVMADPTGELEALISPDLHEDLSEFLNVNSVLILKKFSILTINKNKHYVNITADNLVRIYSCKDILENVKIVHIQQISNKNLEQEIRDFIKIYEVKYKDCNFEDDLSSIDTFTTSKYQNDSALNNITNTSCFKSNKYHNRHMNMISESNSISKLDSNHIQQVKQSCTASNGRNLSGMLSKAYQKELRSFIERPSTSTNIFEEPNNSLNINLSLNDFQDEFVLPEVNDNAKLTTSSTTDSKQTKLDSDKIKSKEELKCENTAKELSSKNKSSYLLTINSKNQRNIIGSSKISILTQNDEDSDLIKEIFCDLDAETLFDEDF